MIQHHTPDTIRAALQHIPPNLPRDEWARVGMAIKSEFPDETGYDLFFYWSQPADNFDARACRDAFKSFKSGGGVTIGTLLHLAKSHGYGLPKDGQRAAPPSPEALAERQRQQEQAREREQAETDQRHEAAATEAANQWASASDAGQSPYLERKGVQAHGLRFAGDAVLVPLRDAAGKLWNVQSIAPSGEKRFLAGGRKSGLWHMLGTVPDAPADVGAGDRPAHDAVILLAEGYATAATLHQATGWPVAVAFDAGNLGKVAQALRQCYPAALLVLCGDDDQATQAKTGNNPGRTKATAAAHAVHGLAVFPIDLAEGGSDFNDMHQAHGLAAVRACVVAAVQAHRQATASASKDKPTPSPKKRATGPHSGLGGQGGGHGGGDDGSGHGEGKAAPEWDRFHVSDEGVFYAGVDKDGEPTKPEWVCSRLDVLSFTRDQDGGGWGFLLSFTDPLGKLKTWAMPARMLSGDGAEYRSYLLSQGLRINTAQRARNLMTQYLQSRKPDTFTTCTDRIGWHGRAFVLPRETIGDDAEPIVFQSDAAMENTFTQRGTAEQWREHVGALCVGNSRLAFAVACAFAGPLLRVADAEQGGFHFYGDGSSGKTTTVSAASSVYGNPETYKKTWRTTDNSLEATAVHHNDALLVLDEVSQCPGQIVGEIVYMLGNGQGKGRATRGAAPRPVAKWQLLVLSSGEKKLETHIGAAGIKIIDPASFNLKYANAPSCRGDESNRHEKALARCAT